MRYCFLSLAIALISGCSKGETDLPQKQKALSENAQKPDLFKIGELIFKRYQTIGYEGLSDSERVFICVWALEGEVYNGGFDQYYDNPSGDHASEAVDSLRAIGANKTAELVRNVNALFGPSGPSPNRRTRQGQLLPLSKAKMDEFAREYAEDKEGIRDLLATYVIAHEAAFQPK